MYEDLSEEHMKKGDEDDDNEDSGTWSYSYPSYSRFTFTGKTKSRLGRSHRLNQQVAVRDNSTRTKDINVNSGLTDIDNCNMRYSSQEPKTPGMSWLQKDKLSTNNFTPGSNLFRQTTVGHDSQVSCNDSGVDVSSQSNFMFTLKNDSTLQSSSSCKRNLAFNTPFKFGENRQESSLKELNHLLHQNSFPKLKFTTENSYENKENAVIEPITGQGPGKESVVHNVFQSKSKQTSDKGCELFSSVASDNNKLNVINSKKLLDEPNKPPSVPTIDEQKFDDEPSDTPIDLSSGKILTHENIFSRSFQIEREQIPDQLKETTKENMSKDEIISHEKSASDGLSCILPKFLAPVNKAKCNGATTNTSNPLSGNIASLEKATVTKLPVIQTEVPKPSQPVINGASSWFSASILGTNSSKPSSSSSAGELKPMFNHGCTTQKPSLLRKNNDILISNKDPNENVAAKNYDQISAIVNLSNCGNENLSPVVVNELSKIKPDSNLSEQYKMKVTSTNEFTSKNLVVEDRMKTLTVNSKTIRDYKSVPITTTNTPDSNISDSQQPNGHTRDAHSLNFNSKKTIPLSLSIHDNISLKKSSDVQLSSAGQAQICSEKITKPQEPFNDRNQVTKGSNLPPSDQLVSVNQDHFSASNERVQCLQQERGIGQQKTYLAPQQSSDHRISNDFPHVKPGAPQLLNSRLNCHTSKKPQNFKMSAPRGLMTRSNTELYVNGQVYTTLSTLGRGGSSEVYQVLDESSSKLMAIKCVDLSMVDKTIAEGYLNEIDLLSKLQGCSSVIRMFDYEYVEEYKMLYVVMEKGDTDLSQLIRDISKTKKISMSMIIYYWTEMLTAVRDIHEKGIIHSDLKPANFLLVSGRLKLIDFGIASSQGDMTSVFKEVTTGTWNYMSPEAIKNTSAGAKGFKITYKSDVWSLGCILYNLLYGKTPFSHITSTWSKLQAIADPNHQIEFPQVGAPLVLAEALQSCLHREPKLRPTVAELLALPYHASGDSRHLAPKIRSILPHECWIKISHLFQEVKVNEEDKNTG